MTGPTLDIFVRNTHPQGKSFRDLDDTEKAEYIAKYKAYKATGAKDEVIQAYNTWEMIMEAVQHTFAPEVQAYEEE